MRQAELNIGADYAVPTYEPVLGPRIAARVRLLSVGPGGMASVQVIDPGQKPPYSKPGAQLFKLNATLQVITRQILCPWQDWVDRAAMMSAKRTSSASAVASSSAAFHRRLAERTEIDPGRTLPESYDEDRFDGLFDAQEDADEREVLARAHIKASPGPLITSQALRPLLGDLPVPVVRDILAAGRHGRSGAVGTVAAVFARAAGLLEMARVGMLRPVSGYRTARPDEMITAVDAAFARAVQARASASGGQLLLPPVPLLPAWIDEDVRDLVSELGWLRVAVAASSGTKLHAAGCRSVHQRRVLECAHVPWWTVALEVTRDTCGRCGGPGLRDLVALAGFAAAVDVWEARGCEQIESWQQQAFQRLLAETASARAEILEPDITLAHRVVSALVADPPGEEGWDAYGLGVAAWWHRPAQMAQGLPADRREAARVLLQRRIGDLESVLPASAQLPDRASAAGVDELRARYAKLKSMVGESVPELDRLMFTLRNAAWGA